jgi:hypothetical protein
MGVVSGTGGCYAPPSDIAPMPVAPGRLEKLESEMATLREELAILQTQVMNLYHSTGQPYPYEGDTPELGRRAAK